MYECQRESHTTEGKGETDRQTARGRQTGDDRERNKERIASPSKIIRDLELATLG